MMFQFLSTKVEKRLMGIKEYVYCLWQIYFYTSLFHWSISYCF